MNPEYLYLSLLNQVHYMSQELIEQCFNNNHSFESVAKNQALQTQLGFQHTHQNRVKELVSEFPIAKIIKVCEDEYISAVTVAESDYPKLLKQIHDPPPVLYYKGVLPKEEQLCIAVVGNRRMTPYGKYCVEKFVGQLSKNGVSIISGLAYGIDATSHVVALDHKAPTFGIIGSGVDDDSFYPSGNLKLAHSIIQSDGGIISEYPPLTNARKYHFVARNRIISGLSEASIIIECREKSGALITADFALEQNRLLYTVPGAINSENSTGPNKLIQQGASLLLDSNDLLLDLGIPLRTIPEQSLETQKILSENEQRVVTHLSTFPDENSFDHMMTKLHLPYSELVITLNKLQLSEIIKRSETGNYYIKPL